VLRDPVFGRTLIIGPGGVFVDLLARVEVELFPVSAGRVEAALRRLPIWPLLEGYRGKSAADVARVVAAICAICDAAESLGDNLIELEINPLLVTADDACAVDALLTLKRQT
jgi:acetate---CoA ligase (ADP-forming)